jgi:ethanolamine utilization protein EutA
MPLPASPATCARRPAAVIEAVAGAPAAAGGRVFFSSVRRSLEGEDEIRLVSVGVDIGSSTSHLVFSRLVLERVDSGYVVAERAVLHESEVLLTPYAPDGLIDAVALRDFVDRQYALAGLTPALIDTGALILTGVAVRRGNARAIGEMFAAEAGKFVSLSAGDALEATLAAYGSGAAARSARENCRVMNVDIGGGTSKIAVCEAGAVSAQTAIDIGARIVSFDGAGRVQRIEAAGAQLAADAGLALVVGEIPDPAGLDRMVELMALRLLQAMQGAGGAATEALLRLPALPAAAAPDVLSFSGGVSEYVYGREPRDFGDLGPRLAAAVLERSRQWARRIEAPAQCLRATVIGASQYTVQVSGSTIFVEPQSTLPMRNVAVIAPRLPLAGEVLEPDAIASGVQAALARMGLDARERPVALCYRWEGSASFARLDAFCRGVVAALGGATQQDLPLVLVGDGDVGGLVGLHFHAELRLPRPVVSIDGVALQEFDFIDIGALLETSGAVPVVIKSLVFPASAATGRV